MAEDDEPKPGHVPGEPRWPERHALVRRLIRIGALRTEAVATAFLAVPRHAFLPPSLGAYAYRDTPLALRDRRGRLLAVARRPSQLARVLEALEIEPGMRVMQVGAGSGYGAALLRRLVGGSGRVLVAEEDAGLRRAARGRLARQAPGVEVTGPPAWRASGPAWDRIVFRAGLADFPAACDDLVPSGGRVAVPFALTSPLLNVVAVFERTAEGWRATAWVDGEADPAQGVRPAEVRAGFWVSVPGLPERLQAEAWAAAIRARPDRCPVALAGRIGAADWRSFAFFLGLSSGERLFLSRPADLVGLIGEDGVSGAAMGHDAAVRVWGPEPPTGELEDAIEAWVRLGLPPLERFRVRALRAAPPGYRARRENGQARGVLRWLLPGPEHTFAVELPERPG